MSRIISYPYDNSINAKDAWVGTDEASRKTKQYTAEALAEYLNISGSISIIGQMTYRYGTTPLNGIGTLAVFGGGPDIVAFSAVTKLTLSNQDIGGQRVVEFLNLLVGSDVLIAEQGAISTFGYYSIDSYATNATDPDYYDLGVTFKSGNGSMRSDRIYEAQNFVLANDATQSPWNTVPDGISYTAANVGVGTVTPSEKLEVVGSIKAQAIFIENTSGYNAKLLSDNLTTAKTFLFPDNEGTIALTSDIPAASQWDNVTGGINYAGGNTGIGTTNPGAKLDVDGDALINGLTIGKGVGSSSLGNTVFGKGAFISNTTGLRNVAIGSGALLDNTTGNYNIVVGQGALENNTTGNTNVAIGVTSLQRSETAGQNTAVGHLSLGLTSGAQNTAIGYAAGYLRVGGTNGNSIDSVFIGALTASNGINSENEIVIGTGAESAGSNTVVLGNDNIVSTRLKGDVIVANGNVGIGTTSPGAKLDVDGDVLIKSGEYISWGTVGATSIEGSTASNKLQFRTNSADRMIINSSGNVGIGTVSPSEKLEVSGSNTLSIKLSRNNTDTTYVTTLTNNYSSVLGTELKSGTYNILTHGNSSGTSLNFTNGVMTFDYRDSAKMRITSSGNVGIGTTNPSAPLSLGNGGSESLELNHNISSSSRILSYNRSNNSYRALQFDGLNHIFKIGSNEKMRIDSSGNVGIGTTSPGAPLSVVGSYSSSDEIIEIGGGTGANTDFKLKIGAVDQDYIWFQSVKPGDNYYDLVFNPTAGNVGIGTASPGAKLHVNSSDATVVQRIQGATNSALEFYNSFTKTGAILVNSTQFLIAADNSNYLNINTGGSEKMRITSAGNVGIGTTSPSQKLEVDGEVLSDGYRLSAMQTAPAARDSAGTLGEIRITSTYIYVCYATDSWSRVALDTSW